MFGESDMKENRKIFWITILMAIIGITLILLSEIPFINKIREIKSIQIVSSIGVSLLASSIILMCNSYISFNDRRKKLIYQFYSNVHELRKKVFDVIDWINWHEEESKDCLIDEECIKFINKLNSIKHFKFDKIYEVTDDFCSLYAIKKCDALIKMKKLLSIIQENYNIHYNKRLDQQLWLVEEKSLHKNVFCKSVMKDKFNLMNHEDNIKSINKLLHEIMIDSGIKEYDSKVNNNVTNNQENQDEKT